MKKDNCSFNKAFNSEINKRFSFLTYALLSSINFRTFLKWEGSHSLLFSIFINFPISSPNNFFSFFINFFNFFLISLFFSLSSSSFGTNCFNKIEIPVSLLISIINGIIPNSWQNNLIKWVFPDAVTPWITQGTSERTESIRKIIPLLWSGDSEWVFNNNSARSFFE